MRFPIRLSLRPAPKPLAARTASSRRAGFSLIELMAVMTLITLAAGFVVPAVKGVTSSNTVNSGASKLQGLLNLARSEAIAQHTIVRFVVATDWPTAGEEGGFRRVSLWTWQPDSGRYLQLGKWEELPVGLVIENSLPDYVRTSSYAQADASTVRGTCVLSEDSGTDASFTAESTIGNIPTRYIEFLPSGSARIPGSPDRRAIFVTAPGFVTGNKITHTEQSNGNSTNWAQVNVDTLTGRAQIYRP
jgi:prepilin-type N-terminal cleavage/methylation domain-containing protein